jgi:hypothetical protein
MMVNFQHLTEVVRIEMPYKDKSLGIYVVPQVIFQTEKQIETEKVRVLWKPQTIIKIVRRI